MGLRDAFRRGMVASAAPASGSSEPGNQSDAKKPSVTDRATKAFAYYDALGDGVNYPSHFYERPMSAVDVFPEWQQDDGSWIDVRRLADPDAVPDPPTQDGEPIEEPAPVHTAETSAALDIWEAFHDKGGGRDELQGRYGLLMFLAGEGYLVNLWDAVMEEPYWLFVSQFQIEQTDKAKPDGSAPAKWKWKEGEASSSDKPLREPNKDEAMGEGLIKPYRLWNPHPKFYAQADAPIFSQLDRLETIMTLGLAIRATARSRLAKSGILYINDKILPKVSLKPGQQHPWFELIGKHFTTPIRNADDASATVPFMVSGSLPASEAITHITVGAGETYPEVPVIQSEIDRVAAGADLPAEVMTGLGNTNHWNGWLLDDQQWSHVRPIVERMVTDFQRVYFFPALKDAGADLTRFRLTYDESAAVVNPDRGAKANKLHDQGAISDRANRIANGFDDDDMPSDDNPNNNPKVLLAIAREEAGGKITAETGNTDPEEDTSPGDQSEVDSGPPGGGPDDEGGNAVQAAAMSVCLIRCREIAGSRLRNKIRYQPELKGLVDGVPNDMVAAKLGRDRCATLNGHADPHQLVMGACGMLDSPLMHEHFSPTELNRMRTLVELHAAATLFEEHPRGVPR